MMEKIETFLKKSGISPTPVRLLVFRCLQDSISPLSLSDIESILDTVDKSTISRTLNTFKDHKLIQSFNDGSGSTKYEINYLDEGNEMKKTHVHFRCEKCGVTQCMQSVSIPDVTLPEGFHVLEKTYVLTGLCPKCS